MVGAAIFTLPATRSRRISSVTVSSDLPPKKETWKSSVGFRQILYMAECVSLQGKEKTKEVSVAVEG